ncbi:hypothetical protein GDO81_019503 [Engystomops pustulosus]|uniref:Uncharacterized protein n=1 Tax=Engystomops pustulosus TaxID=76066 RepID=A0AAV6ZFQ0_ENGPU|nr:hypothetical protein GDO81_019503 [Engystomops pustulosus]
MGNFCSKIISGGLTPNGMAGAPNKQGTDTGSSSKPLENKNNDNISAPSANAAPASQEQVLVSSELSQDSSKDKQNSTPQKQVTSNGPKQIPPLPTTGKATGDNRNPTSPKQEQQV